MGKVLAVLKETFRHPFTTTILSQSSSEADAPDVPEGLWKDAGKRSDDRSEPLNEAVGRNFKMVFLAVLVLVAGTLGAQFWIVVHSGSTLSAQAADLVSYLRTIATAGSGAVFGLIGGKAV